MQQADISKVRASVHQQCGSKVMIQLDRGRNKVDIQQGVIQHAYPSVFTILVNDERVLYKIHEYLQFFSIFECFFIQIYSNTTFSSRSSTFTTIYG